MLNKKLVLTYGDKKEKQYAVKEELNEDNELKEHEVKIKVNSCALSHSPYHRLKKLDETDESFPVGRDISGVIVQVGKKVTTFQLEDEVSGVIPANSKSSGCGFYCIMSEYDIVKKPDKVSHVDAASGIGDSVKAYTALFYQAKIASGESVLITDACSGYGIIANQLAQYWGAKVIVAGSTDEEMTFLKSLSPLASKVIDLRNQRQSLVDVCLQETGGLGVDCVLDNKVELYSEEFLDSVQQRKGGSQKVLPKKHDVISCLGVAGRWVTQQHDLQLDPPDSELLTLKCASVCFLFEDSWTLSRTAQGRYIHILNDVMTKMASGDIRPTVHHTILFDDCLSSLQESDSGNATNIGKTVVKM